MRAVCRQRIYMVVHQAMKGVNAAHSGRVDERESSGSGGHHAVAVGNDIGDVIGNKALSVSEHLPPNALIVEENQAIGGRNRGCVGLRVGENSVDAKKTIVFEMPCSLRLRES